MAKELPSNEQLELKENIKNAAGSLYKWLKMYGIPMHERYGYADSTWYITGVSALNLLWKIDLHQPHDIPDTFSILIAELPQGNKKDEYNSAIYSGGEKGKEGGLLIEVRDDKVVDANFDGDPNDSDYGADDDEMIPINVDELLEIIAALELSNPEELRQITASSEEERN